MIEISPCEIVKHTTVLVRTVGERTTEACIHLLHKVFPKENIHVIKEVPFSKAVHRGFEIGLGNARKWTLVIDADVLVRDSSLIGMIAYAETTANNTFVIQGLVYDRILGVLRPAGNHLYRTTHIDKALKFIPREGTSLRPESEMINSMADKGYSFIQRDFIIGLHDYEQEYISIAKKSFLHALKHHYLMIYMLPIWKKKSLDDIDFGAVIIGAEAGQNYEGEVLIDSQFLEKRVISLLDGNIFIEKPLLAADFYNEGVINKILDASLKDKYCQELQEKIFPRNRWNCTLEKGERVGLQLTPDQIRNEQKHAESQCFGNNLKITFVAYGPNQINGPNQWLQRMLPALMSRGFTPKVIFLMHSDKQCQIIDNLRHAGIECRTLKYQNYTEQNILQILHILKNNPPDIFVPNLSVPAYFASKWVNDSGIPTIGIIRSDDNFHHELIDYFIAGLPEYRLTGVVCKSKYLEESVLSKGVPDLPVLRCASGTELPSDTAKEPQGKLNLVYTGRLIQRQKRIFDVINSLKNMVSEVPDTYATVYGEDRESGRVIGIIKNLNLGERLQYGGLLKVEQIFPALLKNHVFVLLSDYEGMSTSLMEAMACGLVPICTKTRSGAMEIIKHDENGLLVDNREDDFLNAVKRLKYENGLWARLSKAARETIEKEFTIEICADRWAGFLTKLAKRSAAKKTIHVPNINEINLPPVKVSDNGICREDKRMPGKSVINSSDNFLNPQLTKENMDLYIVRSSILHALKAFLPQCKGTFLDIGCGEMPYKSLILPHVEKYIGLDIENHKYQKNVKPDIFWNGRHIPLDDNSVDCAMATELFEHVTTIEPVLNAIKRVLKPGGSLFFTVPFLWPLHDNPQDEYRYTPFSLKRHLQNAGFSDVKIEALGGWDASLAQMMGLWVRRNPMTDEERNAFVKTIFPFYQYLLERENSRGKLTYDDMQQKSMMITGLSGTAVKQLEINYRIAGKIGVECPICGSIFAEFMPYGVKPRPNALCTRCGSLERHRLLWLYLKNCTNFFTEKLRVLDIAPTKGLSDKIKALPNIKYISIDKNSNLAMRHMDITDLDFPDSFFDCVICYHVLEHIPDDRKAIDEIFRVMKPGGWAILQSPINGKLDKTLEGSQITDPAERKRLFGQEDHVRYYGLDYKDRLEDAGFIVNVDDFSSKLTPHDIKRYAISHNERIYVCNKTDEARGNPTVLAIICPQVGAISETFIRKHIEFIAPGKTVILTGSMLDNTWFHGPIKIIPNTMGYAKFTSELEKEVVKFLKENNVTRILCEFGCIGSAVIELNQRELYLPVFVHFHGQDASEFLRKPEIVSYYKWMGQKVSAVIAVSIPMVKRLSSIGIPSEKIKLVHYGVNIPDTLITSPEKEPCCLITVSRLVAKKGIMYLLKAFKKAVQTEPGIYLDIIGDGPLRGEVEKFISDHTLNKFVRLYGQRSNAFVLDQIAKSSVYVQHSITDPETGNAEGLPNSILEASAYGLPVVATFHEGIPEAVEHEITGFLVNEGDVEKMADYMIKLAKDGSLRRKMGLAGREKVLKDGFTTQSMINNLREIIGLQTETPVYKTLNLNNECHASNNGIAFSEKEHDIKKTRPTNQIIKRILFINHSLPPYEYSGTPISTLNHALGMKERGIEVAVMIPSLQVNEGFKQSVEHGLKLYKVPFINKYQAFFRNIPEVQLNAYLSGMNKIIHHIAPDIIHINDCVSMPIEIIGLFHNSGIPVVRNVCNDEEICLLDSPVYLEGLTAKLCEGPNSFDKCARCFYKNVLRKGADEKQYELVRQKLKHNFSYINAIYSNFVDGVVFTHELFKEHFTKFVFINPEKIRIIPRGFDFDFERNTSIREIDDNVVNFAFLGNLVYRKGVDVLLKAFEEIAHYDGFRLYIFGATEGSFDAWIESLQKKYVGKIIYCGHFEKDALQEITRKININISPSYFETYNRVVRESIYLGMPVIATDFYGSSIVEYGVNGIKIPIGDFKALANAMIDLINNHQLVAKLSKGAIETNIPKLEDEIDGLLNFYDELIRKKQNEYLQNTALLDKKGEVNIEPFRMAEVLFQKGAYAEAIDAYKKAIETSPSPNQQLPPEETSRLYDAYYNLALSYVNTQKVDEAIAAFQKAVELNNSDATIYNNLGVLYFRKKMHDDARRCFEKALAIDANYAEAQQNLEKVSSLKNS